MLRREEVEEYYLGGRGRGGQFRSLLPNLVLTRAMDVKLQVQYE